jgi:general secretion pathway protein D
VRTDDGVMSLKGELRLSADERTNSIIISAARPRIALVLSLVHKLDVSTTSEVRPKVFRLTYADATTVASQLNSIFEQPQGGAARSGGGMPWFMGGQQQGGARQSTDYAGLKRNVIVADVRTNSVVVTATAQNMKEFEAMIAELDAPNVLSDITRTFPLKFAKASDVASTLTSLFRGNQSRNMRFFDLFSGNSSSQQGDPIASLRNITLVADVKTNTLLVTGPPQAFAMVESIIAQLDRRTPQVFIEVVIVDVSLDDSTKFGVEWSWANDPHSIFKNKVDEELGTAFDLKKETLGMKYSILNTNLKALLYALTTRSNVQVKSVPSITTADNVAAKISIGQDEPFVSSETETTGGNIRRSVDFKNVSITLNVTPRVSEASGLISLDVQQTINELMGRESELNAPIIANREAKTTVTVSDGQTIVIGGIIKENVDRTTSAVPVISKIPVIGELFKSTKNMKTKSELMVFITPHILRDEKGIDEITARERGKLSDPKPLAPETTPPTAPETK